MADILANIIDRKRQDLLDLQKKVSFDTLTQQIADARPVRDFYLAMTQPKRQLCVLSEVKKASPSAGLIREDFDPVAIAKAYAANGASAISCLTDEPFFQGSLTYLSAISQAVDLPVMRKDFIIDPYQIYEARAAGADALLLIAECLSPQSLYSLHKLTGELGMSCLLEIFDPANLDLAQQVIADQPQTPTLLGINNRDLKAMVTHLDHTLNLVSKIHNLDILVSESGIKTGKDVRRLRRQGIHRILIGEYLMRQPDPGIALAKLIADSEIEWPKRDQSPAKSKSTDKSDITNNQNLARKTNIEKIKNNFCKSKKQNWRIQKNNRMTVMHYLQLAYRKQYHFTGSDLLCRKAK